MTSDESVLLGLVRMFDDNGGLSDCAWDELERIQALLGITTGPHRPASNPFVDERAASIRVSRARADAEIRAREEIEAAARAKRMENYYLQLERDRLAKLGLTPLSLEDRARLVQEREARERERQQEREQAEAQAEAEAKARAEAKAERDALKQRKAEREAERSEWEKEADDERERSRAELQAYAKRWQQQGGLGPLALAAFGELLKKVWPYTPELPLDFVVAAYRASCRAALQRGTTVGDECLCLQAIYDRMLHGKARATNEANHELWQALHPDEEQESGPPKPKTLPPPVEGDEEEDWRPLFLRGGVVLPGFHQSDEERADDQGRYLETWLPYWREQFEHWVHLWEELEEPVEAWAHAVEEPKERPKVTAALLRTFHNRNQVWRR